MKVTITLHENQKNNWTAIVEGHNKDGKHYHNKKVKHAGSSDSAIQNAVKTLNLGEYTVSINSLSAQKAKDTLVAKLGRKLVEINNLDIAIHNENLIVINFWDNNTIDLDKKRQVFVGTIFEADNQLKVKITKIDAVYTDDLMDCKERKETEATFTLVNEYLFAEINKSEVKEFSESAIRCEELIAIRLKAQKCK